MNRIKKIVFLGAALSFSVVALATPVIDDTPTRVQTQLTVGGIPVGAVMRHVGTLRPKAVGEISSSRWTIDCAGMDREHVDWRSIREYVGPLGIARMRQQAGWARCEKDPGRYEFTWLDQAVCDAKRQGVSTWLELSYGNPAYKGGGGRQLAAGFPSTPEALAAWDRWVEKIVTHYKGVVRDFCVWNEPDINEGNDVSFAADFAIRTAEIVKRIVPDASIAAFALSSAKRRFVEPFVIELARRGKTHLFTSIAYHHYNYNPDDGYEEIDECRRIVAKHAPNLKFWEGEGGTWSEWGGSGALGHRHWTELSQAKYDLRRSLGDLGHGDDTEVFHLCDMEYRTSGFHDGLVRYGLLKTAGQAEAYRVLKVKIAYYAIQNAVSVFNDSLESLAGRTTSRVAGLVRPAVYDWRDRRTGLPVTVFWDAAAMPHDGCEACLVDVKIKAKPFAAPVWVDLITGDAYEIAAKDVRTEGEWTVYRVPAYDAPTFVADRTLLDLQQSWFARATDGWRTPERLPAECLVRSVRFFGPFPKSTQAKTAAELERLGAGRVVEGLSRTGRFLEGRPCAGGETSMFQFQKFCPKWPDRGTIPDLVGFAVFTVDSEKGGPATLFEKNDWWGQFFVNGEPVGKELVGDVVFWTAVPVTLKPGRNEIVFRTWPGSSGQWTTELGLLK